MKHIARKFEAEMAKAVSLIVTASHAAALEAVGAAFGARQAQNKRHAEAGQTRRRSRSANAPRRNGAEIQALEEQFLQAIWELPGEAMSVLAPRVGTSPRQLQVVVARLKRARKLKTVGERQFTRYFPAEASVAKADA